MPGSVPTKNRWAGSILILYYTVYPSTILPVHIVCLFQFLFSNAVVTFYIFFLSYALRRELAFGFDPNQFVTIVDGDVSQYTFTGLTPGEEYKFTVVPDGFDARSMNERTCK